MHDKTIDVSMEITDSAEDQKMWAGIVDDSIFTISGVARNYDINVNQLRQYLKNRVNPQQKDMERIVKIMKDIIQKPRLAKHGSRGYATEDEWEQLQKLGIGPERDRLMAAINKRSKAKGKEK